MKLDFHFMIFLIV